MKNTCLLLTALLLPSTLWAQPPQRPLIPLNAYSLEGYEALSVDEAFNMPDAIEFASVAGVAFNSAGNLIVLHRGEHPFLEFDSEGNFIRAFGDASLFNRSHGLRIDADDNLWVSDVSDHVVMKMDADGKVLMTLGQRGEAGVWDNISGIERLAQPNDIAFDSEGNIYIAQGHGPAEPRVLKFSANGDFIRMWGSRGQGPGQFAVAHSIEIDKQDQVYVADRENFRIQIFDTDGELLNIWQYNAMACAIYLHDDDHMYMTTGFDGEFAKLDTDGSVIGALGRPGSGMGEFGEAHFLTLNGDDDVFIADVVNRRVQVYAKTVKNK